MRRWAVERSRPAVDIQSLFVEAPAEDAREFDVLCSFPGVSQVVVAIQCLVDVADEIVIDQLRGAHLCQQLSAVPDLDVEVRGEKVHPEVVGDDDGRPYLPESQHATVGLRRWRSASGRVSTEFGEHEAM